MGLEAIARWPISSSWWRGWVWASFRGLEMKVRRADIVITINTNTTPSSEVELPIIWFTDYSVQHSLLNRTLKPQAGNQVTPSLLSHGNYSLSTLKTQYFKFKHVHHHYLDDTHPFSLSCSCSILVSPEDPGSQARPSAMMMIISTQLCLSSPSSGWRQYQLKISSLLVHNHFYFSAI